MKFIKEITIDWYDNILKCICQGEDQKYYYCCLLALDKITDQKIYLVIDLDFLKGGEKLKELFHKDSFKENWGVLQSLIKIKRTNVTYIIKTKDLRNDDIDMKVYKSDFPWPKQILWGEFPGVLDNAAKLDDWWSCCSGRSNII